MMSVASPWNCLRHRRTMVLSAVALALLVGCAHPISANKFALSELSYLHAKNLLQGPVDENLGAKASP